MQPRMRRYCPTCTTLRPVVNYACALCGSPVRVTALRRAHQPQQATASRAPAIVKPWHLGGWHGLATVVNERAAAA
jgi:hypothetical protein